MGIDILGIDILGIDIVALPHPDQYVTYQSTHILWYMESLVNLLKRDSFIISQN